jgi:NitT/TauT family transport system substrate-binding protein
MRRILFATVLCCVFLFSVTCLAQTTDAVKFLTARPGWQAGVPWFGTDLGIWERNNLKIQHTGLDSSRSVMEAFAAGQGDLAIINVSLVANAYFRGIPLTVIAGVPLSDYVAFAMNPEVKSLKDLKGKKVAVWAIPSEGTIALEHVLKKDYGYAVNKDFTYVRLPAPNLCTTLQRKEADAGVVFEPYASGCLLEGARRIAPKGGISFDPPKMVQSSVIVANPTFLKQKGETVRRFLQACRDINAHLAKNGNDAINILTKYSGEPRNAVAKSYEDVTFTIAIDLNFHRIMLDKYFEAKMLERKVSDADLAKLYDLSYLPK